MIEIESKIERGRTGLSDVLWLRDGLDDADGHLSARVDDDAVVQLERACAAREETLLVLVGEI